MAFSVEVAAPRLLEGDAARQVGLLEAVRVVALIEAVDDGAAPRLDERVGEGAEAEEGGDGVAPVDVVDVARAVRVRAGRAAEGLDLNVGEEAVGLAPREPVLDAQSLVDVRQRAARNQRALAVRHQVNRAPGRYLFVDGVGQSVHGRVVPDVERVADALDDIDEAALRGVVDADDARAGAVGDLSEAAELPVLRRVDAVDVDDGFD